MQKFEDLRSALLKFLQCWSITENAEQRLQNFQTAPTGRVNQVLKKCFTTVKIGSIFPQNVSFSSRHSCVVFLDVFQINTLPGALLEWSANLSHNLSPAMPIFPIYLKFRSTSSALCRTLCGHRSSAFSGKVCAWRFDEGRSPIELMTNVPVAWSHVFCFCLWRCSWLPCRFALPSMQSSATVF